VTFFVCAPSVITRTSPSAPLWYDSANSIIGECSVIWGQRAIGDGSEAAAQDTFGRLFMKLGGPPEMMLISTDDRLIVSLPNEVLLAEFDGFTMMSEADLPKNAVLVIGDQDAFDARFNR
jgi:hypothetical protein